MYKGKHYEEQYFLSGSINGVVDCWKYVNQIVDHQCQTQFLQFVNDSQLQHRFVDVRLQEFVASRIIMNSGFLVTDINGCLWKIANLDETYITHSKQLISFINKELRIAIVKICNNINGCSILIVFENGAISEYSITTGLLIGLLLPTTDQLYKAKSIIEVENDFIVINTNGIVQFVHRNHTNSGQINRMKISCTIDSTCQNTIQADFNQLSKVLIVIDKTGLITSLSIVDDNITFSGSTSIGAKLIDGKICDYNEIQTTLILLDISKYIYVIKHTNTIWETLNVVQLINVEIENPIEMHLLHVQQNITEDENCENSLINYDIIIVDDLEYYPQLHIIRLNAALNEWKLISTLKCQFKGIISSKRIRYTLMLVAILSE
ncbi:hypothetical protein GJ496_007452 [Pomphorhynchus laevis]|nr:hypothetical protein GJ496_007452 [Pomphorhynchus laevis]